MSTPYLAGQFVEENHDPREVPKVAQAVGVSRPSCRLGLGDLASARQRGAAAPRGIVVAGAELRRPPRAHERTLLLLAGSRQQARARIRGASGQPATPRRSCGFAQGERRIRGSRRRLCRRPRGGAQSRRRPFVRQGRMYTALARASCCPATSRSAVAVPIGVAPLLVEPSQAVESDDRDRLRARVRRGASTADRGC